MLTSTHKNLPEMKIKTGYASSSTETKPAIKNITLKETSAAATITRPQQKYTLQEFQQI